MDKPLEVFKKQIVALCVEFSHSVSVKQPEIFLQRAVGDYV